MSLLGLDVGTTGCKVVAFSEDGKVIASAYREYPLLNPHPDWYELDPERVWSNLAECILEVNACLKEEGDPATALAISAQGEAVTPVGYDGQVLAHSPVTSDNRALAQARELEECLGATQLYQITGQPIHPMYSLPKIMWWRQHQPELYARTWKFMCYGDYVLWKLGLEPVIDDTMAARTMAFDIGTHTWSAKILQRAGVDLDKLPRTAPSGTLVGVIPDPIARALGFGQGVQGITGGHDQPCGAVGAGVISAGEAMYAIGTTECLAAVLPEPIHNLEQHNFACYPHAIANLYITLSGNQTGGRLLRWYRDLFGQDEVRIAAEHGLNAYDLITAQAAEAPSRLFVLPHFAGGSLLDNDPTSKGAILGLTFSTGKAEIIKALLEGITYEQALSLKYMRASGVEVHQLRAIGGGARSQLWLQLKADIMAVPVAALSVSEAACLGAALLAGCATGVYGSIQEAISQTVSIVNVFIPDRARSQVYQERLEIYEKIYPTLQSLNRLI